MRERLRQLLIGPLDLDAVESMTRDLERVNWTCDLDRMDLMSLLTQIQQCQTRLLFLEHRLSGGIREIPINSKRALSSDPEELRTVGQLSIDTQEDLTRLVIWRLHTEFGVHWTVSHLAGEKYLTLFGDSIERQQVLFMEPFRVRSAWVDMRRLLEHLVDNAFPHILDPELSKLTGQCLHVSRTNPGRGRYNHKLRKRLTQYSRTRPQLALRLNQGVEVSAEPPKTASFVNALSELTMNAPANGIRWFPGVVRTSKNIRYETFPGTNLIFLRHLTGQTA